MQMALIQTNKDLISKGIKEFNILLNQQVSLVLFQRTGLKCWEVGEDRKRRITWSGEGNGGLDGNHERQGIQIREKRRSEFVVIPESHV